MANRIISGLGFRPFFTIAAAFSVIAMALWVALLNDLISLTPYGGWRFWHAHEMLFGYGGAVIAGFLLTAVRTWTGLKTLQGASLMPLIVIWLPARVLMLFADSLTWWLISLDLLFWLYLGLVLAWPVIQKRQFRNLFAAIAPLLLLVANAFSHVGQLRTEAVWQDAGLYGGLFIIVVLMGVIGARVIPLFTRNTTGLPLIDTPRWMHRLIASLLWLIAILHLIPGFDQRFSMLLALLMFVVGTMLFIRMGHWHFTAVLKFPMLWSLHLSYAFIPVGLILLGFHHAGLITQADSGIHAITVGGIGGLTLSMMARVSLGHTGRLIQSDGWLVLMFVMVFTAAVLRIVNPLIPANDLAGWSLSATFWLLAFLLFVLRYLPILLRPRVDGKPG